MVNKYKHLRSCWHVTKHKINAGYMGIIICSFLLSSVSSDSKSLSHLLPTVLSVPEVQEALTCLLLNE